MHYVTKTRLDTVCVWWSKTGNFFDRTLFQRVHSKPTPGLVRLYEISLQLQILILCFLMRAHRNPFIQQTYVRFWWSNAFPLLQRVRFFFIEVFIVPFVNLALEQFLGCWNFLCTRTIRKYDTKTDIILHQYQTVRNTFWLCPEEVRPFCIFSMLWKYFLICKGIIQLVWIVIFAVNESVFYALLIHLKTADILVENWNLKNSHQPT